MMQLAHVISSFITIEPENIIIDMQFNCFHALAETISDALLACIAREGLIIVDSPASIGFCGKIIVSQ